MQEKHKRTASYKEKNVAEDKALNEPKGLIELHLHGSRKNEVFSKKQTCSTKVLHKKTQAYAQAGITLVALVITIIVLLILAGVTIRLALNNNGIINRAKDAEQTWANASSNEEIMMREAESDINTLVSDSQNGGNNTLAAGEYLEGQLVTLGGEELLC